MRTETVARIAARTYSAAVFFSGLVLYFLAGIFLQTHAPGAAGVPMLAGLCYAATSPLIWRGYRWAMLGALAVSVAAVLLVASESPSDWWVGLPFVALFGALTAAAIATGTGHTGANRAPGGNPIAKVYAAATYLYSFVIVFLWPSSISMDPRHAPYVLLVGAVAGAISVPIWRGRIWAMIAALALALVHWLSAATLNASVWTNPWYLGAPVVSVTLTALCLFAVDRANAD